MARITNLFDSGTERVFVSLSSSDKNFINILN